MSRERNGESLRWSINALINEYEGGVDSWLERIGVSREAFDAFMEHGAAMTDYSAEGKTHVTLIHYPDENVWRECKQRALITMYGKGLVFPKNAPTSEWRHKILEARHSPIRVLRYSFLIENVPSNISVHLARHVHSQPFVSSLRNDRQEIMDGDAAPRNTPVNMIYDVNAEELMTLANKRLCTKAAPKTTKLVAEMCRLAEVATPELAGLLVPMCEYHGGVCHEMEPCGRNCPSEFWFKYDGWKNDGNKNGQ